MCVFTMLIKHLSLLVVLPDFLEFADSQAYLKDPYHVYVGSLDLKVSGNVQ